MSQESFSYQHSAVSNKQAANRRCEVLIGGRKLIADSCLLISHHLFFRYFPTSNASFFLAAAGIFFLSVMIA